MKNFGYDRNNAAQDYEMLPKGGYVVKILNVKFEEGKDGKSDRLKLQVDIAEGDYAGYYKKQYESDTREDKKYRGIFEIWCPRNDGTEQDGWTKKTFDTCFAAIEDSNPGFRFNGTDEKTLVGKIVGAIIYEEQYRKDGDIKTARKFYKNLVDVDKVRKGTFKTPKDKLLKENSGSTTSDGFMSIPTGESDELPF